MINRFLFVTLHIETKIRERSGLEITQKKGGTMITVSDAAKAYIDKLQGEQPDNKGKYIRVGVRGGGCSGLEYQLEFDSELKPDDQVFEDKGVTVLVDRKSLLY